MNKSELLEYVLEEFKKGNITDKTLVTKIEIGDQETIDAIIKRVKDEKVAKPKKPKKRKPGELPEHDFTEAELTAMAGD